MAYKTEIEWVEEKYMTWKTVTTQEQVMNPITHKYESKMVTKRVPVEATRMVQRPVQVFVPDPPKPFPSRPFGK